MYHFVKFNNTWYLKPEKLEDVIDHFKSFVVVNLKKVLKIFVTIQKSVQVMMVANIVTVRIIVLQFGDTLLRWQWI